MTIQINNQTIDITNEKIITVYGIGRFAENDGELTIRPLCPEKPLTLTVLTN